MLRKKVSFIATAAIALSLSVTNVHADSKKVGDLSFSQVQNLNAKGFDNSTIERLDSREIDAILKNKDARYGKASSKSNELLLTKVVDDQIDFAYANKPVMVSLSDTELEEYKGNKNKVIIDKLNTIINDPNQTTESKELAKYYKEVQTKYIKDNKTDSNTVSTLAATSSESTHNSERMDSSTLTGWVDEYRFDDSTTYGHVLGMNWEWSTPPSQTWTDTTGFTFTGSFWAEDSDLYGGYYSNGITLQNIPIGVKSHAFESKYDIRGAAGSYKGYGRVYGRIMQLKAKVPVQYFNVYGAYAHKTLNLGSITLSADSNYKPSFSTSGAPAYNALNANPVLAILTR